MSVDKKMETEYVVYCVNEFARNYKLPYVQAFNYLDKYEGIDFLTDFYVENSQMPMNLVLEDVAECCRSRGGVLV